ncbi:hypothetical protein F5G80_01915, partial [Streptococcus agalactiae]
MKQEDIIINSIVFKKQLDKGFTQVQLIKLVKDLGFSRFEIRQELLQDPDRELPALKACAVKRKNVSPSQRDIIES